MTTPGSPEKENPVTSKGHSSVTFLHRRPTWYQTEGIAGARCGSLDSSGRPVLVCSPEITHEFDPISSLFCPNIGGSDETVSRSSRRSSVGGTASVSVVPDGGAPVTEPPALAWSSDWVCSFDWAWSSACDESLLGAASSTSSPLRFFGAFSPAFPPRIVGRVSYG